MKQLISAVALVALIGFVGVTAANAQSADTMVVTIPFDFAVSNQKLPAGEYLLRRSIDGARVVMQIRSKNDSQALYLPIHALRGLEIQSRSKLVFSRYGDQYFLSQVWISGRSEGQELRKTTRERLLQREVAKKSKPETVDIASKVN